MLQMSFEHVSEWLNDEDASHQAASSHLPQTIQAEGSTVMARHEDIEQQLLDQRKQHQDVLPEHVQGLRELIQELRESKEERGQLEGSLTELSEWSVSLNAQVKGKGK